MTDNARSAEPSGAWHASLHVTAFHSNRSYHARIPCATELSHGGAGRPGGGRARLCVVWHKRRRGCVRPSLRHHGALSLEQL